VPIEYTPGLCPSDATPQGVAEWARKEFDLIGQKLGELDVLQMKVGGEPASATAPGRKGQIIFGSDGYVYFCSAADTWLRLQPVTWP
jgi:hypothetical protein